jgi:hypothetical protein
MPALKKPLRKVGVLIVAVPLLIAGVVMLVIPGPGLLAIFLAFVLLASEFDSLQPYKKKLEAKLKQVTNAAKGQGGLSVKKKPSSN